MYIGSNRLTWKLIRTLMKVNNDDDHVEALKINGTDTIVILMQWLMDLMIFSLM